MYSPYNSSNDYNSSYPYNSDNTTCIGYNVPTYNENNTNGY